MRRALIGLITLGSALLALWFGGGFDWLAREALAGQREFQSALGQTINALRRGDTGSLVAIIAVCFAYGFFHAVGPGHGKVLIASYGVGRQVALPRLMGIALVSSLGQAVTALVVVYGSLWLLGWGRQDLQVFADVTLSRISALMLGLIGVWLIWRGVRHLRGAGVSHHDHHDHHDHDHSHCDHVHLSSASQIAGATSARETAAMIAAIAIRPCTGALLLLLLTWQFGLVLAGVLGVFAMALGTASVVLVVALLAGGAARSLLVSASDGKVAGVILPLVELGAGLVIVLAAWVAFSLIRPL